jgi:proteasome lid subunit RPN8/RPN11
MDFHLQIPAAIHEAMLAHAQAELPNECVGLLAGTKDGVVVERFPLVNALAHPRRFESEGKSHLAAERRCRELGLEWLAVYHSHPTSPPVPSKTDTDPDENLWVGQPVVSLIISLMNPEPEVRGYWLTPHGYREAKWCVTGDDP